MCIRSQRPELNNSIRKIRIAYLQQIMVLSGTFLIMFTWSDFLEEIKHRRGELLGTIL